MISIAQTIATLGQLQSGGHIEVGRLRELNKALHAQQDAIAKATIGTIQQGVAFTGASGEMAPMVPQSMSNTMTVLGATMKQLWLEGKLTKVDVHSTLFEDVTTDSIGIPYLKGFIGEGGGGTLNQSQHSRGIVQIKMQAERRQVTDLATFVNMLGYNAPMVDKNALANEEYLGMQALMVRHERNLWLSDSANDDLSFDGMYKQIAKHGFTAGLPTIGASDNNYLDKRGGTVTGPELVQILANLAGGPTFTYPGKCVVHPRVYGVLEQLGQDSVRHNVDANSPRVIERFSFGAKEIWVTGPGGQVMIEAAPLMTGEQDRASHTTNLGEAPPVISAFTVTAGGGQITVGANAASKFVAADAGEYIYRIIAIGEYGVSAPLQVPTNAATITIAAGDVVTFDLPDTVTPGHGAGKTKVKSYILERSTKGGAVGTSKFVWEYPVNASGAGGTTRIIDANLHLPSTAPIYLMAMEPQYMYWADLLPVYRRPLPAVDTTLPFLLLKFGSPRVKAPTKQFLLDNCALSL